MGKVKVNYTFSDVEKGFTNCRVCLIEVIRQSGTIKIEIDSIKQNESFPEFRKRCRNFAAMISDEF